MIEREESGHELDDSYAVESRPRQRWGKNEILRCAKYEYPNVLFGIVNALTMFDAGKWTEIDLWEYFRECGGFRSFTDHAKRWNAEMVNLDEKTERLVDLLNYFAVRGTAACASHDLPQIRDALRRIKETVDSIHLG